MEQSERERGVAWRLFQLCRVLRSCSCRRWNDIGLYRGQPFVIEALSGGEGMSQTELAAAMHVQPATMTHMVQHMQRAGLIERKLDELDRRVWRVFLTDAGRALSRPVEGVCRAVGKQALDGFTVEECDILQSLLLRVQDNLTTRGDLALDSKEDGALCAT